MKVLVILFQDIRIEGVEAVVAIPKGKTATQVFDQWVAQDAASQKLDPEETIEHSNSFTTEEMDVLTLPPKVRKSRKAK